MLKNELFDIVCVTIDLAVFTPFIFVVMLAIYIEDPHGSPHIFAEDRMGIGGKISINCVVWSAT